MSLTTSGPWRCPSSSDNPRSRGQPRPPASGPDAPPVQKNPEKPGRIAALGDRIPTPRGALMAPDSGRRSEVPRLLGNLNKGNRSFPTSWTAVPWSGTARGCCVAGAIVGGLRPPAGPRGPGEKPLGSSVFHPLPHYSPGNVRRGKGTKDAAFALSVAPGPETGPRAASSAPCALRGTCLFP